MVRIGDSQITLKKDSSEAEQRQSPNGPYEPIYRSDTDNPNAYPVGKQQSQPASKAAASKGDCSLQKLKSDTNLSGVDTVVCCGGQWANVAKYASDGFHPLHWDGSKWTFPPIDGETCGAGLSRGCWNRSTVQSVGAGHCPEGRRLPTSIRSLKPPETRIPRGATRNRVWLLSSFVHHFLGFTRATHFVPPECPTLPHRDITAVDKPGKAHVDC